MKEDKNMDNGNDFIFGIRAVIEAINAGKQIDKVLVKRMLKGELVKELMDLLKSDDIPYQMVPEEKLTRITRKNHQGVIALMAPIDFTPLEQLVASVYEQGADPFFIMLDGVSDVRNFGAIVRTADCAGANGIIIPEKGAARIGGDAVKTSAGALFKVPVCKIKNFKDTISYLQECGIKVYGATEKASQVYYQQTYPGPVCIVMGAEDTGLSPDAVRSCDELIKIPILGEIQSLNVSVAASILMYEVVRQRFLKTE